MTEAISQALHTVLAGGELTADAMQAAVGEVMDGQTSPVKLAALLTALAMRGETATELVGAARAMRQRAVRIPTTRRGLLDTCGTGGDRLHTFNISTATALVAAAVGVPVAKHGNRAASSKSGSADVLEALGVNVALAPESVAKCIDEIGIGFCFAPLVHGAMKHAAPVRGELGFRTVFNLLGPLTNPAGAEYQLIGASSIGNARKIADALRELGRRRVLVVCGAGELDEIALWGETTVFEVGGGTIREHAWTAATFGLPACKVEELQVASADESAAVIRAVLAGNSGPARNIVLANTAAALFAADHASDLQTGVRQAAAAIDLGQAAALLSRLIAYSQDESRETGKNP